MANYNISGSLTPESKTKIKESLESIKTELPFTVSLTNDERQKLRKIGPHRIGYVTEVNLASNANQSALAKGFQLDEYNSDIALFNNLAEIRSLLRPLYDAIDNTLMALGSEVMAQSDRAYDYLKVAAKKDKNENLNTTVKKIAAILKQTKKDDKAE